ncbi:flavin-containing amine oxidoreductase-domain containing protein [Rhypophila decipiens]|uniref:Flavin-containing amine oxidoreductase-domain containing protein n=1 Tax=Rhypophila decipiens TaxID=261697 RepID=A0AAN7AZG1_9PEZI|nr:flavin-containing amine oxidoreductase-domain containing protein [Rhypophila decipiens]
MKWLSAAGLAFLPLSGTYAAPSEGLPLHLETKRALNSRLSNVHIDRRGSIQGPVTYTYGSCTSDAAQEAHHTIGETTDASHDRLVWIIPEDVSSGGCISAWSGNANRLVGRSDPQHFDFHAMERRRKLKRRSIAMTPANGIDPLGPWFDGVKLLKASNLTSVDAEAAKNKNIAIVGAGMSGLMTYLCLTQSGMKNVEIIEAGHRLGGRVHTAYLSGGPFDYSYQEMGPMRFPDTISLNNETYNVSDHQMVFQLAAEMNKLNSNNSNSKDLHIDFIPWYQSSPNGLVLRDGIRLPNGMPPTVAQIEADPSLSLPKIVDPGTLALAEKVVSAMPGPEFFVQMAQNMFKAHREWINGGLADGLPGDHWSEFAFMVNYLNGSLNSTNYLGGSSMISFWDELYEGFYFSSSTWKTIDGGLNRLPLSFTPLVSDATTFGRKIEKIKYSPETKKIELHSKSKAGKDTTAHDFAIITLPFSVLKKIRIAPPLPQTIASAIVSLPYTRACKVALEFKTRFWEDVRNVPGGPIYGSCSTSPDDILGIGSVCYPSYNLPSNATTNSTFFHSKAKGPGQGPAAMLASYVSTNDFADTWDSVPEAEHVEYVLNAIAEVHGEELVREQYTGKYSRVCWGLDPLEAGSWASPAVGMHELFIPEYFKTVKFLGNRSDNSGAGEDGSGLIFVGEHTSYTHGWISSALESGIRGSVQVLLELGLVDEAKALVEKWMGRWIDV